MGKSDVVVSTLDGLVHFLCFLGFQMIGFRIARKKNKIRNLISSDVDKMRRGKEKVTNLSVVGRRVRLSPAASDEA